MFVWMMQKYDKTEEGSEILALWNTCPVKDGRQMKNVVDLVIIVFTFMKQCIY